MATHTVRSLTLVPGSPATRAADATDGHRQTPSPWRAERRAALPWLLVSAGTAVAAAVATSAWLVQSIHLF